MRRKKALAFLLLGIYLSNCGLAFASEIEKERLSPKYVSRLSIIPGMGQFYNKKKTKAWTIVGLELGAITGTLVLHNAQIKAYRKWEEIPESNVKKREVYRTRLEDLRTARNTLIWLGGMLWVYNMFDAYVDAHFYEFDQRNKEDIKKSGFYLMPEGNDSKKITLSWVKYF